jgi:hypothetical protein
MVELNPLPQEVLSLSGKDCDEDEKEQPLPDSSEFPRTNKCNWSFDTEHLVLHADFRQDDGKVEVTEVDEKYFLESCERHDITCIASGLASSLSPELYDLKQLVASNGELFINKVRRFKWDGKQYSEHYRMYSMKYKDFVRFVEMRMDARVRLAEMRIDARTEESNPSGLNFAFTDHFGFVHHIPLVNTVLYVIDEDLSMFAPKLLEELQKNFSFPGIFPGGEHCLMSAVRSFVPG